MNDSDNSNTIPESVVLVHFRLVERSAPLARNPTPFYSQQNSSTAIFVLPGNATLVDFNAAAVSMIDNDRHGIATRARNFITGLLFSIDLSDLFVQWADVHDRLLPSWIRNDEELEGALRMMAKRGWVDNLIYEITCKRVTGRGRTNDNGNGIEKRKGIGIIDQVIEMKTYKVHFVRRGTDMRVNSHSITITVKYLKVLDMIPTSERPMQKDTTESGN
ncbi:hypothetical protein BHYA_0137g00110 [Botrytis hyacinthi]|uniref:Uncharacterized protein n=1 Tax=Botrytis hyacinthi TaxID=278943 RepID=A0A4Z1GKT2_9HELO|nr:hypothetical protein BHYA_0137g00110 [Botrytis hyacinthi]